MAEAAYKVAEHRPLGEIYNLVWRATRAAAEAAQKNPRAPRMHMSTHAINRFEADAQRAVADPEWELKNSGFDSPRLHSEKTPSELRFRISEGVF
ncbi:hypothetical protein ACIPWL_29775 [Streptomyces sp. NPDC090023]|uniref:hypothetical protein n=1 Tax=unclassified Streptomyces TaxID=2593676 RepID=UPI0038013130